MPDAELALEGGEGRFAEDLSDQAHVLVDEDPGAVGDRDAGGFLAAVLKRVEAEEGEFGYFLIRRPDAEETASFLRRFGPHPDVSLSAAEALSLRDDGDP